MTPQQHLTIASAEHTTAWKYLDEVRAKRGHDGLPDWPDFCFVPVDAMRTWLRRVDPEHRPGDPARLIALGAWRAGQGSYRFEQRLSAALLATPIPDHVPATNLHNLPEWSVYIETPGLPGSPGFFAILDHDIGRQQGRRTELWLLIDINGRLLPTAMALPDAGTVADGLATIGSERPAPGTDPTAHHRVASMMRSLIAARISLLLYLCGSPEVAGDWPPPRPAARKTRRLGPRLYPPSKPAIWYVGEQTGEGLPEEVAAGQWHHEAGSLTWSAG
ncbi:MAG: hypothetical protein ACI8RZ_008063 [Myxococcota bacterium]|jgi:hypothetical protein